MEDFLLKKENNIKFLTIPNFIKTGLTIQAFTTKDIGNLHDICNILKIKASSIISPEQVHGNIVAVASSQNKMVEADALITNKPGLALSIQTADCVPIFILDPKKRAVGLIHAGWKGSAAGIANTTIKTMKDLFGTSPENCLIGIGPSIGPCCYEVGKEVIEALRASVKNWKSLVAGTPEGKWYLNLRLLNKETLLEVGCKEENMTISHLCTSCRSDLFYSYRRDGKTGRMFGLLMLK